jgi:hypothetical protein
MDQGTTVALKRLANDVGSRGVRPKLDIGGELLVWSGSFQHQSGKGRETGLGPRHSTQPAD